MNPLLVILSLIDIASGLSFYFSFKLEILYIILLAKGLWTLTFSLPSKDFFSTSLGFLDFFTGFLGFLGIFSFKILGIAVLTKGTYSIIFSF